MAGEVHVNCTMCHALAGDQCSLHGVEIENPAYTVCAQFRAPDEAADSPPHRLPGLADLSPDWIYEIDTTGEPTPLVQVARRRRNRPSTGKLPPASDLRAAQPERGQTDLVDRFRGALLGLAAGEALGFPAEGRSPQDIEMIYGGPLAGMTARIGRRHTWPVGQGAKDTQLVQLVGQSLLEAHGALDADDLAERLVRWLPAALKPGKSTIAAIESLAEGHHWCVSGVDSNGAGGTTRVVPLALLRHRQLGRLRQEAVLQCLLTHTGAKSLAGTVLFATAIASLVETPPGRLHRAAWMSLLERAIRGIDLEASARLHEVTLALDDGQAPHAVLGRFKTGGFVLECLPSALYCFLRWPQDPVRAVLTAVNAGFDACATGAMTGALAGAYLGLSGLPEAWSRALPVTDPLLRLADQLHALAEET
ncbi:MAG: ADP-ribosylglycohydrolase family protein [Candidatus Sericytochromatia bacterium]|nr:ADP-ribosylglycohydrolase family protein [Candidatus Sericytochromatia bacterium]